MQSVLSVFFGLFLVARGDTDLTEWRVRLPVNAGDVLRLLQKSGEFAHFRRELESDFGDDGGGGGGGEFDVAPGTVRENATGAHDRLTRLTDDFMGRCYRFVVDRLRYYCDLAIEAINSGCSSSDPSSRARLLESIALPRDRDYCVITALHDFGHERFKPYAVDLLLENVFFAQTLAGDRTTTTTTAVRLGDVKSLFRKYLRKYKDILNEVDDDDDDGEDEIAIVNDLNGDWLVEKIVRIKRDIADFSDMFCPTWTPLVSAGFLAGETTLDDVRDDGMFVYHIFQREKCEIKVSAYRY